MRIEDPRGTMVADASPTSNAGDAAGAGRVFVSAVIRRSFLTECVLLQAIEPRLLVPRSPDSQGPFYKVLPEGLIHDWDGSEDILGAGQSSKDPTTWDGVDFNRQWVTNWNEGQAGSGDFPFSEVEMRHLAVFIHSKPKIFGIMGYHTGVSSQAVCCCS